MSIPTGAVAVDRHGIGWVYSWGVWFMAPHFNALSDKESSDEI